MQFPVKNLNRMQVGPSSQDLPCESWIEKTMFVPTRNTMQAWQYVFIRDLTHMAGLRQRFGFWGTPLRGGC